MDKAKENISIQRWVAVVATLLFLLKLIAYYLTQSVAVLTDALESTVNVIAGFIGLYSLHVAAKPRDADHPYGHGKAEFLSAAVEGALVVMAGLIIIYEAIVDFIHPHPLQKLDKGMYIIGFTALVNFAVGAICIYKGRRNNSMALLAGGKHLQSDTWSTLGIVVGLVLIWFTHLVWLDGVVSIIFAGIILYTGYHILRHSIAGIMDEADMQLLQDMVSYVNQHRRANWIDLHNLRVIKYGGLLHVDCHLTVPWYLNVLEAHREVEALTQLIRGRFGLANELPSNFAHPPNPSNDGPSSELLRHAPPRSQPSPEGSVVAKRPEAVYSSSMEFFVHTDACTDFACRICTKTECPVRKHDLEERVEWTLANVVANKRHQSPHTSDDQLHLEFPEAVARP